MPAKTKTSKKPWSPASRFLGEYAPNDGSMAFYGRINTLAAPDKTVLDLGAGRAAWFEDDTCKARVQLRHLQGKFGNVVGADVDEAVLQNRSVDTCVLIRDGRVPLEDNSVDVIIADYVLEHIDDVPEFVAELDRILKPGGWFCARTPHKYCYVALIAGLLPEKLGDKAVSKAQPTRKEADIFPKRYRLNTRGDIRKAFSGWEDMSYIFRSDPAYYFGKRSVYWALETMHHLTPAVFSGNIFAFLRKPVS